MTTAPRIRGDPQEPLAPRRIRCRGNCLAGEHPIATDRWRTDYLMLVRSWCVCGDCDCTFGRATIEGPRHDQPFAHRKRRTCRRGHAA